MFFPICRFYCERFFSVDITMDITMDIFTEARSGSLTVDKGPKSLTYGGGIAYY